MKSLKSFFGIDQHKPIPGTQPILKDSRSQVFTRFGVTPKLGTSVGILYRAKHFFSKLHFGRGQAKDRISELGENTSPQHIKKNTKAKPKEVVESMLLNSKNSPNGQNLNQENEVGLIPSYYKEH